MEIALVLGLLVLAIVLFASEKLSVDVITLLLLSTLVLTDVLSPAEAFAGFSSEIIVILGSIFVIGGALRETACSMSRDRSCSSSPAAVPAGCSCCSWARPARFRLQEQHHSHRHAVPAVNQESQPRVHLGRCMIVTVVME